MNMSFHEIRANGTRSWEYVGLDILMCMAPCTTFAGLPNRVISPAGKLSGFGQ